MSGIARIPRHLSKNIHELRQYDFSVVHAAQFRKLTEDLLHLRTKHSRLIGYYLCELGGLNKAFHIWEYDSIEHRAKARAALVNDPVWIADYLKPAMSMVKEQKNCVCSLSHGDCKEDWPDNGFYQVFEVKLLPQSSENGSAIIDKLLSFFVSKSYGTVMASFAPLIGDQSLYWIITRHENPNEITDNLPDLSPFLKDTVIKNRMLVPLHWQTWKKRNS